MIKKFENSGKIIIDFECFEEVEKENLKDLKDVSSEEIKNNLMRAIEEELTEALGFININTVEVKDYRDNYKEIVK